MCGIIGIVGTSPVADRLVETRELPSNRAPDAPAADEA